MKKLTIHRETIRNLSSEDLQKVAGGLPRVIDDSSACGGGGGGGGNATYSCDCTIVTCATGAACPTWDTCFNTCPDTCIRNC